MRILLAPDSFKGTATAAAAAAGMARGVRAAFPDATVMTFPMADGGEGTAAILGARGTAQTLPTTDANGRLTEATYYLDEDTAYIDVAAGSGLPAVADSLDPLHADTYGTGVLIADAESKGAKQIVLCLGGSATTDGGTGILTALGAAAHDARGYALPKGGAPLVMLDSIDTAQLNMKAAMLDYTLLADTQVDAAACASVYAPQKGATPEQVALLTGALLRLCEVTELDPHTPSFGAAGGIAIGLTWVSQLLWGTTEHVTIASGAQFVAEHTGLAAAISAQDELRPDLIITGEGRFDAQSLTGKAVGHIALLADAAGVPLGIVAGQVERDAVPAGIHAQELSQEGPLQEQLAAAAEALVREVF